LTEFKRFLSKERNRERTKSRGGEIIGARHKSWPLHGVQFHPESFLTEEGPRLLKNFIEIN
jgi:anthranilate/para-aminobenzoate synthase component II